MRATIKNKALKKDLENILLECIGELPDERTFNKINQKLGELEDKYKFPYDYPYLRPLVGKLGFDFNPLDNSLQIMTAGGVVLSVTTQGVEVSDLNR